MPATKVNSVDNPDSASLITRASGGELRVDLSPPRDTSGLLPPPTRLLLLL